MTRWLRPLQTGREQDADRFDPIVEGARLRLPQKLALALWQRARRDATDGTGHCSVDDARRRFAELAGQVAARRGLVLPEVGRLTRAGQELDDDAGSYVPDLEELFRRVPGRTTLVAAEARARRRDAEEPQLAPGALPAGGAPPPGRGAMAAAAADSVRPGLRDAVPASARPGAIPDRLSAARLAQLWAPPGGRAGRFVLPLESAEDVRRAVATRDLAQSLGQQLSVPLAEISVRADEHAGRVAAAHGSIAVLAEGTIYLDPGVYDPETALGRSILAHELAHVAQQRLAAGGGAHPTVQRRSAAVRDRAPWAEVRAQIQADAAPGARAEARAEIEAGAFAAAIGAGHAPPAIRIGLPAHAHPTWTPPGYRGIPPQTQISPDGFIVLPGPVVRVEKLWYEQFFAETHTNAEQMDIVLSRLTREMPWIAQITPAQRQAAATNMTLQATFDPGQDTAMVPVSETVQRWIGLPPGTDVDWVFPEATGAAAAPGAPPRRAAQVYLRASRLEATAPTPGGRQLSPALANQLVDRIEAETGLRFNADHRAAIVARGTISATPITGTALAFDFTATREWCVASFGEAAWAGFEQRLAAQGPTAGGARASSTGMTIDDSLDPATQQFALEWLRRVFGEAQTGAGDTPLHITASVVEAMRAIDALPDDQRARVLERLRQPGHGAPTTATLAEQLRGVVQAIRMEDEYARLGIQPGDAADPIFNRAVEGQIVNHSDLLFTGKRAEFSFQTTSHDDAFAVPWVDVTWVVRETATHDTSAAILDRGHTSHRDLPGEHPEHYGITFDHVGTFEINAVVNHRFYQPASFTIYVEVKTEEQRLAELEGQTFDRPGGMFGNVIQGEDHTFGDTSATDSHDRGRILFGQMSTVCRPGDPPLPSPTAPIDDQIDQIRRYIDSGHADPTQLSAAQSYLHELEETQQRLRAEQAEGAHVVYVQGAYLSRTARARSQELKLVADARRVNGNAWRITIHDVTQAFDNRNSSFHAERATYTAAAEACFVDLCKAYPTGRMSVRMETLDDAGASTGQFIGWELDCTSTWEEIHSVVWNPTVQLVVNIAGTVTMIFLPVTAPFLMPALIAYNGVETVGNLVQYYERDAVHATDVAMTVGQLAMDLIPYIGRVGRLVQVGSRTYHIMEGLLMAGDAVMVAGQALEQVQDLRFGIVRQAAELNAQIEQRQQNNPSDPELPRLRQQFAELQTQSRDAWARVAADLAVQQAIMRLPSHAATHLMSIHEGRIQASRSEITEALGSRGGQAVRVSDVPHLERALGVPVERVAGSGDVKIVYEVSAMGGITGVRLQVGERASLSSVMHHEPTMRAMQRYEGVTGSLRSLLERVQAWRRGGGRIPEGSRAWEAHLELQKLPPMVQALHAELAGRPLDDAARGRIETQIASLEAQIEHHAGALDDVAPGLGYVASLEHAPTDPHAGTEPHASTEPTMGQAPGHSTTTSGDVHPALPQVPIPPERAGTPRHQELLRLRGSGDAVLASRAPGWTGRLEAEFRWGRAAVDGIPEGYHWTINEAGIPSLVRDRLVDEHGNLVPPRRFDDTAPPTAPVEQRFPLRPEDVQRARATEVEGSYTPTDQTRADQQAAMARRDTERARRDTAEGEVERLRQQLAVSEDQLGSSQFDQTIERLRREHAGEPEVLRQIDDLVRERNTLADARNQVNQQSMLIGQLMARDWVRARYPEAGAPVHGGVGAASRSGDFDAVYVVPRGEGQRPLILIIEAKGGSSTLGTRQVGGQTVQQGTGAYMREIARLMAADPSVTPQTRSAMRDVSLGNADVRYVLIEAPIGTSEGHPVLRPGRVSEFNVSLSP